MTSRNEFEQLFKDPEFLESLRKYEEMSSTGAPEYFEADQLNDFATYYSNKGKSAKARETLLYSLSLHPGNIDSQILLSRSYMLEGNMDKCIETANAITDQDDIEYCFLCAEICITRENREYAEKILRDILVREKKHIEDESDEEYEYTILDTYKDIIDLLLDYNEKHLASKFINEARRHFPEDNELKELAEKSNTDFLLNKRRIEEYQEILRHNPYDEETWRRLAHEYAAIESFNEAQECCEYALAISPSSSAIILLPCIQHIKGNKDCIENFKRAIAYIEMSDDELKSNISNLALDCATALHDEKRHEEAYQMGRKAFKYANTPQVKAHAQARLTIESICLGDAMQGEHHWEKIITSECDEMTKRDLTIECACAMMDIREFSVAKRMLASVDNPKIYTEGQYEELNLYRALCDKAIEDYNEYQSLVQSINYSSISDEERKQTILKIIENYKKSNNKK